MYEGAGVDDGSLADVLLLAVLFGLAEAVAQFVVTRITRSPDDEHPVVAVCESIDNVTKSIDLLNKRFETWEGHLAKRGDEILSALIDSSDEESSNVG